MKNNSKKKKRIITFGTFYGIDYKFLSKLGLNDKKSIKKLLNLDVKCHRLDRIMTNKSDFNIIKSFINALLYNKESDDEYLTRSK